ncbi:unnamed protein product [Trifolium pratense]|uniref:Uncharacterized protein n=1 Tax=Trifolium pratense TaxID=57577 RepID=A0ACB0K8U4_TRIPR|nr:unnamed protein product [Trifolium pratense]
MLFNIPVWIGVLLTGLSTLMLLALQQYGVRKLEFLIAFLVFTIAACFWAELGYAKPDAKEVVKGLFVPQLKGSGATGLAISLLGAMVMPHNLFLHSALVLSRKIPRSVRGIKEACIRSKFYDNRNLCRAVCDAGRNWMQFPRCVHSALDILSCVLDAVSCILVLSCIRNWMQFPSCVGLPSTS